MIHKPQAEALAQLLALIRPGDWRPNQTLAVLAEHRETKIAFKDIAEAAVRAANDPGIKSPTGIFLPGRHWEFERHEVSLPKPPPCPEHDWEPAHYCLACLSEVKAGDRPLEAIATGTRPPVKPAPPPEGWRPPRVEPRPIPAPRNIL